MNRPMTRPLTAADFAADAPTVARALVGATLLVDGVGGLIVECEAYDQSEPAAHSFRGPTPRTRALFGPPGHAYVYRSYGLHWCLNLVCREAGHGAGVLIRALEPRAGIAQMQARRGCTEPRRLAAGPGRVGQALGVSDALDGLPLAAPRFVLRAAAPGVSVVCGPRIGIRKAVDLPWRFGLAGSPFLSRRF